MWRYRHILALQKIAIYGEAHVFSPAADFRSPLIFAFDRPSTKSFLDQLSLTFVRFGTAAVLGAPHSGLIVIYVKRVSAAVLQGASNADPCRNLPSSRNCLCRINTRWTCLFNACSRSVCINSPCFCHCLAQTRHSDVPIAHLIGSLEEYEYGEASSDCSRRG